MTIQSTDLRMFQASNSSDTGANGGIMSSTEIPSGVTANLFPNASAELRLSGGVQYRKLFFKNHNADDLPLLSARVWQDSNTVGGDRVTFFPVSQRATQSSITGSERHYGMGTMDQGELGGATNIRVLVEDGTVPLFLDGDLVRISDRADPFSAGNEHWSRLDQVPTVAGNVVTLHLATPLSTAFLSGTKVSSVHESGTVDPTLSNVVLTSALGSFSEVPASLSCKGTIEQSWTVTFTSGSAFDIAGDTVGSVGSGNTTAGASPQNPTNNSPYLNLPAACFSGSFTAGDTVTLQTHPSAVPVMLRRVIPAGTVAVSHNGISLYIDGESN